MARDGLGLVGAPNARDMGGIVALGGRRIRQGLLVRSSALGRLVDEDLPRVEALGLRCVLDLRHGSEIEVAPANRLPDGAAPAVMHLPVFDPAHPVFTYVSAVLLGHDLEAYGHLAEQGTPAAMQTIYRWFVTSGSARSGFAAAVRAVAVPANLPLLFHCSAGKDRTGWLAVILLSMLGVDEDTIREDYLLTNTHAAQTQRALLSAMASRRPGLDLELMRPLLDAREEYLLAACDQVRRSYGSMAGYLSDGLGLDEDVAVALRTSLLE